MHWRLYLLGRNHRRGMKKIIQDRDQPGRAEGRASAAATVPAVHPGTPLGGGENNNQEDKNSGRQQAAGGPTTLRDLQSALDEVASFGELPRGTLRINANETAARLLLRRTDFP
jgi:hypothetical protein